MNDNTKRDYISEALEMQETDLNEAIAIATEGIHTDLSRELGYGPEKSRLYSIRSTFYEFLKNYDAAIEDRSKVISICSRYPDEANELGRHYAYRGYLFRMKGDFQAAIEDYAAAIAIDPDNYRHHLERGMNKLSLEHEDTALDDFKQAFQLIDNKGPDFHWLEKYLAEHDKTE